MTTQVTNFSEAPGFAKHNSTFKNDSRCVAVDFVIGDSYAEVVLKTQELFTQGGYIDWDVNYSLEGGKWVGVTCKDI